MITSALSKHIKDILNWCSEPRIRCTSHITRSVCTLTCNAEVDENDREDNEDEETGDIEEMKAW